MEMDGLHINDTTSWPCPLRRWLNRFGFLSQISMTQASKESAMAFKRDN